MNKKIFLMLFALLQLFSSTIFASDLKRNISLTSGEQARLKENHVPHVIVVQEDIDLIKKNTEIRNKWFFTCDEHTMQIAKLTKWILGGATILGAVIWIFIFWNRKLSREISERRKIEKELQSSENRYRSLCNASFEGIVITDDGVIVEANTVISQILGCPVSKLIGMSVVEIFAPKVRDDVKTKILAGYEKAYKSVGLTKGGVERPVEIQAREFIYKNRQVICVAIRDLSKQYKVMDALRESENKFRAVVTGAHDAIIMMDGHGKTMFWNKAAERIFQYSQNEIMEKNPHEIIAAPSFFKKFKEAYPHFQQTGKGGAISRTLELTALRKGGEEFPIEFSLSAIRIKEKWCAIAVVRDITERKKMAQAIKSALRESDIFGRIGGEEFLIVLIETDRKTAILTCERIRSCIEALSINTGKETVHITVSIGLTFFKEGDDISTISKRSDEALYAAKKNGRNCVVSL